MLATYDHWAEKMPTYPHTAEKMCNEYYRLFQEFLDNREQILARRKPIAKPSLIERTSYQINEIKDGVKRLVPRNVRRHLGSR